MQRIIRTGIVMWVACMATAQENFIQIPKNINFPTKERRKTTNTEKNDAAEKIFDQNVKIAAMVDSENAKFAFALEQVSERRHKELKKWTRQELLHQINYWTAEILGQETIKNSLGEFLALGVSAEEAVGAVAKHMDVHHMEITVKRALAADYPYGKLPYWKTAVAKAAAAEADKLVRKLVRELQSAT